MSDETQGCAAEVPNLTRYRQLMQIDAWVREERHKVMYRNESKID